MKSPFPGMDPYLEQHWLDVHSRLIIYACDQLQGTLPSDLVARVEERVYLEREGDPDRSLFPDVPVVERPKEDDAAIAVQDDVDVAEPLIVQFGDEPITETFIKILDARTGNQVVTVIEFISPTNKIPGTGYKMYRKKQTELKEAKVTLVEIDLLRGGKRVLSVPLSRIRFKDRTRYQAVVRRGWKWHEAEVYALPLHKRLPAIPIPLRPTDSDTRLNLQTLIEQCYQNGRYDTLDYQTEPDPPLEGSDAEWADELLRAAGKRP
ncbi:MAG: DUF4058 family protein [Planctomycetes bacterium]|jgi:hypothetical protein|nr:DUF4058 family protein [Planctomycetota bacterium]